MVTITKPQITAVVCLVLLDWIAKETDVKNQFYKITFFSNILKAINEQTGDNIIMGIIQKTKQQLISTELIASKFPFLDKDVEIIFRDRLHIINADGTENQEILTTLRDSSEYIQQFIDIITNDTYGFIHKTSIMSYVNYGDVIQLITIILTAMIDSVHNYHSLRQVIIYVNAIAKSNSRDIKRFIETKKNELQQEMRIKGVDYGTVIIDELYNSYSRSTDIETNNLKNKYDCVNHILNIAKTLTSTT